MSSQSDKNKTTQVSDVYGPQQVSKEAEMLKYGIICKTVKNYYYGKYRYTSLGDAIAQAKRDEKA